SRIAGALLFSPCPVPGAQPALKPSTVADGLGHDRVRRIISDSKGFLWFCTADGLTRFDGQHFLNFNSATGAPFADINDVLEVPGGDYWIASRGQGLIRFGADIPLEPVSPGTAKRFQAYRIDSDLASNYVSALHRDKMGRFWVGTGGGLYQLLEKPGSVEFRILRMGLTGLSDRSLDILGLTEDPEGSLYVATTFGVVRLLPDGRR